MIGLRQLSNNRLELYASRFPLDVLKPYLLDYYREAYATIVLYEDNIEVYHETGIFSFDASEPETFNYEEFRAPLIEEFHDRLAVCTVENLFLHLENFMEDKPLEDDPFHNLVFSISLAPPSREVLLDWEKHIDARLKRVLYDAHASEHFQLFPDEVCVVYSHDNHFTSVTSNREDLIQTLFEDVVERHLVDLSPPPLSPSLISDLYYHTKQYGRIRLKPERVHTTPAREAYLLVTYPGQANFKQKLIASIKLSDTGAPISISEASWISRLQYYLHYSDLSLVPMVLTLTFMTLAVIGALYFRILFPSEPL